MNPSELSDEDLEKQLAGEVLKGPRKWRGRELAPLTRGLRDLRNKILSPDDTATFHDVALLHILTEAHDPDTSRRLEKRRALLVATDDVAGFKALVSLVMDDLSDPEVAEARKLVNEILGLVEAAEVMLAEKKTESSGPAEPSPTAMPSSSPSLPEKPPGDPTSSAGSCP